MIDKRTGRIIYSLISFSVLSLVVILLRLFLYRIAGITKNASNTIIVIMTALCINDYFSYWLRKKNPVLSSEIIYPSIILYGNNSKVIQWIRNQPSWVLLSLALIWTILSSIIVNLWGEPLPDIMEGKNTIPVIIIGILVGPIIETFLFQVCIIELVKKIAPKVDGHVNLFFSLLVSAILFAVTHSYSASYVIYAFFLGAALSSLYIIASVKTGNTWKDGFLLALLFHVIINLFALIGYLAN